MSGKAPLWFGVIWAVGGALGVAQMLATPNGFVLKNIVFFFAGVAAVGVFAIWRGLRLSRMQQSTDE